jgi:hypothetical protein
MALPIFDSSLLEPSLRGLRKRTRLPTSKSFFLTFYRLFITLSLSDSNKSFSSASLGHGGAPTVVRRLWCLISFNSTASTLNTNRNGVKLVALQTIVLWLHTALGMTSAHLSFFSPSSIFWTTSKIKELAHSTAPLDCGWYTNVKATFVSTW